MPAYNFQKQFVPMILDGLKPHTIRRRRKHPTKAGDVLFLYSGMRTKSCQLFAKVPCLFITPIEIGLKEGNHAIWSPVQFVIDGKTHNCMRRWTISEMYVLAFKDGFKNIDSFFAFFRRYKQQLLEDFEIVWWNPEELTEML